MPRGTRRPGRVAAPSFLRDAAKCAAGHVGAVLHRTLGDRAPETAGILLYHRVSPRPAGLPRPTMNVPPDRFRAQITGLLERGFRVWPLGRLLDLWMRREPVPPRTLVITFDDGFDNIATDAWPVLRELEIPATVFVSTAFLDADVFAFDAWGRTHSGVAPAEAYRPLTGTHTVSLLRSGLIEIGTHTHTHRDFRGDPQALAEDLRRSLDLLRSRFGLRQVPFAFPFGRPHLGYVSPALVEAARRTGVTCALTTENRPVNLATDPFSWGRFNAFEYDTAATLAAKVQGWYGWAPAIEERFSRVPRVGRR
jgi:peptidoglycan/xylan/chitin deacetylase (PgdA/CDA1 family)